MSDLTRRYHELCRSRMLEAIRPLLPEVVHGSPDVDQRWHPGIADGTEAAWYRVQFTTNDYCADLVIRQDGECRLALVRAGSQRRALHLVEAALALDAARRAGLAVDRVLLYRPRKQYERVQMIDPHDLFVCDDITGEATRRLPDVVRVLPAVVAGQSDLVTGVCTLLDVRTDESASRHSEPLSIDDPRTLFHGRRQGEQLIEQGHVSLAGLPSDIRLSARQQIQVDAVTSGVAFVDATALKSFLSQLVYPVHYLDFEAFSSPIPPFPATSVWEHIPYLYTVRSVPVPGASPAGSFYCARQIDDFREQLCLRLLEDISAQGSVVVYGRNFESQILARLAVRFPQLAEGLEAVRVRIVDLSRPFSDFLYYHPEQRGSLSMKTILPILTGVGYDGLEIANGRQANLIFANAVLESCIPKKAVLDAVVEYCTLDTQGMVLIVEALSRLCE